MGLIDSLKRLFTTSKQVGAEKMGDLKEKAADTLEDAKTLGKNVADKLEDVAEDVAEKAQQAAVRQKNWVPKLWIKLK